MRRRRRGQAGHDSLLDVLTNVVGFLVIVLVLVQLGTSHGVSRAERPGIVQRLEDLRNTTRDVADRTAQIQAAIDEEERGLADEAAFTADDRRRMTDEWNWSRAEVREMEELVERAKARQREEESRAASPPPPKERADSEWSPEERQDAVRAWNDTRIWVENLRRGIDRERDRIKRAESAARQSGVRLGKVRLLSVHDRQGGGAKPQWADLDRVTIVCRGGRAFVLQGELLETRLLDGLREVVGGRSNLTERDMTRIRRHFTREDIGDEHIRISILPNGIRYDFRGSGTGESEEAIRRGGSELERYLRDVRRPAKAWIQLRVWDDSFTTYGAIRELAEGMGYMVGWLPFGGEERMEFSLGGRTARIVTGPED